MNSKFIFVTGEGWLTIDKPQLLLSLARLLQARGFVVTILKFDSCLNIDVNNLGEYFVCEDGQQVDTEIGVFERHEILTLSKKNYATLGDIFHCVINKERRGEFGSKSVTVGDDVVAEIKNRIYALANEANPDFILVDVNGNPGQMDMAPFMEVIRQIRNENVNGCYCVHYDSVDVNRLALNTMAVQGAYPDALFLYTSSTYNQEELAKCFNLPTNKVYFLPSDCNEFELPTHLYRNKIDAELLDALNIDAPQPNFEQWESILEKYVQASDSTELTIAIIGASRALIESVYFAGIHKNVNLQIYTSDVELADGVIVACYDRETIDKCMTLNIPTLCIGNAMKCMAEHFASKVMGIADDVTEGDSMTLGADVCELLTNSKARSIYDDANSIKERYQSNFKVKSEYRQRFEQAGLLCTGQNPQTHSVEVIEIPGSLWFIGTKFNPEYSSTVMRPSPIFMDFVNHAIIYHNRKNQNG